MENIKTFEEYHSINEANMKDKYFTKIIKNLDEAIKTAEEMWKREMTDATMDDDYWHGDEGATVMGKLHELWAAFSTGNRNDKSENDEIFK